jgi:hypothetical protein
VAKDAEKETKEKEESNEMTFATIEGKCYCCGKGGHESPACCMKDKIPKEEWAINKAKVSEQSHATPDTKSDTSLPEVKV